MKISASSYVIDMHKTRRHKAAKSNKQKRFIKCVGQRFGDLRSVHSSAKAVAVEILELSTRKFKDILISYLDEDE